jgi:hypothetical protein
LAGGLVGAPVALAGGSAENALIIINPGSAESMYVGNYYKNARNIPDRNVLYLDPGAADYASFSGLNGDLDGLGGYLNNAHILDHTDYLVVANTGVFFVSAPGYIVDGCSPVTRFSQSSVFTLANQRGLILAGNLAVQTGNQYFSSSPSSPRAFSARSGWAGGGPTTSLAAPRYFIGASLGYTGSLGNTLPEILAMIDRSVAVDATRPAGTFYYMSTTDAVRNVRAPSFPNSIAAITSLGGAAVTINGVLPDGHTDCLGVMTGWAQPDIDGSTMGILPGAFGDHLTSWAATFDNGDQTKISAWIRRGVSGSAGEVEEPCNYPGKFPNPDFHAFYFQGMSLGESYLRSVAYLPFQALLIADPLTRPFAVLPSVNATPPGGAVSGQVSIPASASTSLPGASIASLDLLIDGVYQSTRAPGQPFSVNTTLLEDGWHELRVLAYDNTLVKNTGRWIGSMTVSNAGRSVALSLPVASGDMTTLFQPSATPSGGTVSEVRLLHNGRIVATGSGSPASLPVYGRNLGPGDGHVQAEVVYSDGRIARSAPAAVSVANAVGTFSGNPPVAYSFSKTVARGGPFTVELPARFDDALSGATFTIVNPPGQATVGAGNKSYRVMTAGPTACGQDQFTFQVTTPSGTSNTATVTLRYNQGLRCYADFNGDGQANINDFIFFQSAFAAGDMRADADNSCSLNINDFIAFQTAFAIGCP